MTEDEQTGEEVKQIHNLDMSFQSLLSDTEELEIFQTQPVQDVINYQWDTYGRRFHYMPFFFHLYYVFILNYFVFSQYIKSQEKELKLQVVLLFAGFVYPIFHESCQFRNEGCYYF